VRDGLPLRRALIGLVLVGLVATVAGKATFAAFSSATAAGGQRFAAGTVTIGDNDLGSAMLGIGAGAPGTADTSCINVTYSGSLDAEVRLYGAASGPLAPYLTLTITRGTDASAFDTCGAFVADLTNYVGAGAGIIYNGPLSGFPTNWGGGLVDPTSGAPEVWTTSEAHAYKFTVTFGANPAGQGQSGTAGFTWEARNL
jgi:hypothetical protein